MLLHSSTTCILLILNFLLISRGLPFTEGTSRTTYVRVHTTGYIIQLVPTEKRKEGGFYLFLLYFYRNYCTHVPHVYQFCFRFTTRPH
jgi:hypothetical protein